MLRPTCNQVTSTDLLATRTRITIRVVSFPALVLSHPRPVHIKLAFFQSLATTYFAETSVRTMGNEHSHHSHKHAEDKGAAKKPPQQQQQQPAKKAKRTSYVW